MKYASFLFVLLLLAGLMACDKNTFDRFDVVYEVEFVGNWNSTTHPTDFPSNAHFSPMVALSHSPGISIFTEGLTASEGVIAVAETGNTETLNNDLQVLINQALGLDKNIGNSFDSPGADKITIGVGLGYSYVSVISMIAPSPDWFVAASTNLIDPADGFWFDEVTVDALVYDAGSDEGVSFTSPDLPADTLQPIMQIINGPLTEGNSSVTNMGQFIFRRVQ